MIHTPEERTAILRGEGPNPSIPANEELADRREGRKLKLVYVHVAEPAYKDYLPAQEVIEKIVGPIAQSG